MLDSDGDGSAVNDALDIAQKFFLVQGDWLEQAEGMS